MCFVLKDGFRPQKEPITTFENLLNSIKEANLTDFAILSDDGLRLFQLKRYGKDHGQVIETDALFEFIKKKLSHYGNALGDTNLLIALQREDSDIGGIGKYPIY